MTKEGYKTCLMSEIFDEKLDNFIIEYNYKHGKKIFRSKRQLVDFIFSKFFETTKPEDIPPEEVQKFIKKSNMSSN